jgi:N-acetylmuramoyl-L-alanine amidase
MRNIKYIAIHCTDTLPSATVEAILKYWREKRGWKNPGYHYIIKANGDVVKLLDENKVSNGVLGFNENCINVCYIGGKTKDGKGGDTRTRAQENAMFDKIVELTERYPNAEVKGHGEFPNQGGKTCPNFNVKEWLKNYTPDIGLDH